MSPGDFLEDDMKDDPRRDRDDDNGLQKDMRAHLRDGVRNPSPEGRRQESHVDRGRVGWRPGAQYDPKKG